MASRGTWDTVDPKESKIMDLSTQANDLEQTTSQNDCNPKPPSEHYFRIIAGWSKVKKGFFKRKMDLIGGGVTSIMKLPTKVSVRATSRSCIKDPPMLFLANDLIVCFCTALLFFVSPFLLWSFDSLLVVVMLNLKSKSWFPSWPFPFFLKVPNLFCAK